MTTFNAPPQPLQSNTILHKIKEGYLLWMNISVHIPKGARFTIGALIENKFLYLLELLYLAHFAGRENKSQKITECILILDTLKFLVQLSWEAKLISHKQYEEIAIKLDEVGKMLGGWKKSLENPEKKNRDL